MSLSLQEAREEGVLSHMEQLFAIIAQGVGAHSGIQYSQSDCNIILNIKMFCKNMCGFEYNYKESKLITC